MKFFSGKSKDGGHPSWLPVTAAVTDKDAKPSPASADPDAVDDDDSARGWLASSLELAHGLDVSEEVDTIPGDLLDAFAHTEALKP